MDTKVNLAQMTPLAPGVPEFGQSTDRCNAQRFEALGTRAAGVAHDFNNILYAVLGYADAALRVAPPTGRLRVNLEKIVVAAECGRALVERIRAFSRNAGVPRISVHVEAAVRAALDLMASQLPEGVAIDVQMRAGRAAIAGDPTQLQQVVMNLVKNAAQAMEAGGTLRVSLGCWLLDEPLAATTGELAAGAYVVLAVSDTGCGMPEGVIEHIFDRSFTTREAGMGLGLTLVHVIVAEYGGAVDVRSTVGAGSTFTVFLPQDGEVQAS